MKRLVAVLLCLTFAISFAREAVAWIVVRGPYYRPPIVVAPPYGYYPPPAYYYRPPVYVAPRCGFYPYGPCY
jgi:hypothetical protein